MGFHGVVGTHEDLSIDVSITNVGLTLTKLMSGLWSLSRWSRMFSAGVAVSFQKQLESESVF